MTKKNPSTSAVLAVLPLVLVVAGIFLWYATKPTTSHPVASASSASEAHVDVAVEEHPFEETAPAVDEALAEEPAVEAEPAPAVAPRGTLRVQSDVDGADVFLNDVRVGATPYKASGLALGEYRVRVEKAGYTTFEKRVAIAGKPQTVRATLAAATATLRVEANVVGAKVFLDGEERGTTPLEISSIPPGPHRIEVSADGYLSRTDALEVGTGRRDIRIDLVAPPPEAASESVAVKHKHRIGSCEGALRAREDKLEYDSSHKDAFSIAFSEVDRFSLDKETLTVKARDGRTYNFEERSGNLPALASFHRSVAESLETSK